MFISEDWLILFFIIAPFGVIYVHILAFKLGKWLAYWGCYWYTFFTCKHIYVQGKHSEKGSVLFCVNCYHTKENRKEVDAK
tara:strand:- start:1015 stop:1257 length:243 start_codon:yes stop_codon:yes gene_type:complete